MAALRGQGGGPFSLPLYAWVIKETHEMPLFHHDVDW